MLVAAFAGAAVLAALLEPLPPTLTGTAVASDGDTLRLGEERVRLTGLDAPEHDQTCIDALGAAWTCGRTSSRRLGELIEGRAVTCKTEGKDRYGRFLARCSAGGNDLGAVLVSEGLAVADLPAYASEEARARRERRGIWAGSFDSPRQWRDSHGETTAGFDLLAMIRSWFGLSPAS